MKRVVCLIIGLLISLLLGQWVNLNAPSNLNDLLISLGKKPSKHSLVLNEESIQQGYESVYNGKTRREGKMTKRISTYFTCVSCHNTTRETTRLIDANNPEKRLDYSVKNRLPFLQGSTFFGIVNRESWYNDDYYEKYGVLVDKARYDLRESIQLCAQECAQGRELDQWEENAILSYFWTLQIKTSELELPSSLLDSIKNYPSKRLVASIQNYYPTTTPSHFIYPYEEHSIINKLKGNAFNGKNIYEMSCLQCHNHDGVSLLVLDHSRPTRGKFKRQLGKYSNFDLYQIVRWGTYPFSGHKPYMPQYPVEKMSHQQLADLISYLTE